MYYAETGETEELPEEQLADIPAGAVDIIIIKMRDEPVPDVSDLFFPVLVFAVASVAAGDVDPVLDMASLRWQRCGSIEVRVRGWCPASKFSDPWWFGDDVSVVIEVIGAKGIRTGTRLSIPLNKKQAGEKPQRGSDGMHLLPGRYKVIPWPGAPESACRVVEIHAGQLSEVAFEGQ